NAYDDEEAIKTTLLEGKVKVVSGQSSIGNQHSIAIGSAILKPGEQALITSSTIQLVNPDLEEVMAWKNGRFHFSRSHIDQMMRQLCRWYDMQVEYTKEVDDLFYTEIPRNTNLSDALKVLELTGKVHFAIAGKKIIVMP